MELRRADLVNQIVNQMLADDPWEWRAVWVSGLAALDSGDFAAAQSSFNAVYGQVPGELAPKLALALACERGGEGAIAEGLYRTCASTDANYVAAGGLRHGPDPLRPRRRGRRGRGPRPGAVHQPQLPRVPPAAGGTLYESGQGLPALAQAMDSLKGVSLDPRDAGPADGRHPGAGGGRGGPVRTRRPR